MKEQLKHRLKELKSEFDSGKKLIADLEAKQTNLRATLLRISGAIQVLEELLAREGEPEAKGVEQSESLEEART
jgi:ABC-type transporter Mla subunit MlaD